MNKKDFHKIFNFNFILSQLINWSAYIVLFISSVLLIYFAFIDHIEFVNDWRTLTLFAIVAVFASWLNWNTWYRKEYEKTMDLDINQAVKDKYSIHSRYYYAVKDWNDAELQLAIDKFNDEYEKKWLRWVEKYTGRPISTKEVVALDDNGNPIVLEEYVLVDENGEPEYDIDFNPIIIKKYKTITTKGIKETSWFSKFAFRHPIITWRIKTHKYPQSGYKTSMELMSLLSFQEANLNKRDLKGSKRYYWFNSIQKFFTLFFSISIGGAIIPEMISGNWPAAILKLIISLGSIITSVIMGGMNGIRGARIKLSIVEDASVDLELWGNKKPKIAPYPEPKIIEEEQQKEDYTTLKPITADIFKAAEKHIR